MSIKKIAVDFLEIVIDGKVDEAYEKCINMKGKHHNIFFPAGFESLKKAIVKNIIFP